MLRRRDLGYAGEGSHNPEEYRQRLEAFADSHAGTHGSGASTHVIVSHDPAIDLDSRLLQAIEETGADLVVMGSHVPGVIEHLFSSNAGYIASHAKVSVFVVR